MNIATENANGALGTETVIELHASGLLEGGWRNARIVLFQNHKEEGRFVLEVDSDGYENGVRRVDGAEEIEFNITDPSHDIPVLMSLADVVRGVYQYTPLSLSDVTGVISRAIEQNTETDPDTFAAIVARRIAELNGKFPEFAEHMIPAAPLAGDAV
ncbi:hypothetical protein A2Z33_04465 [Candidatus Gottesmanbacteria bacterium RBG_16_52_11]|uniref:Uncharacterized protein n=1 Tax=Candidatus Gottesmanbacteria bacterium RBG_16_52_11 TaxID=1798374 RepID=A0A1F5YW93_9BACT|nr:MAG: hypothetical protein A2Z33_04465 [Candidatus Gottesmanbacteria bacterium RBG_16_52_11]